MSNIGNITVPYSSWITCESTNFNNYSLLWISGKCYTWKYKIKKPFKFILFTDFISIELPGLYKVSNKINKKYNHTIKSEWSMGVVEIQKMVKSAYVGFKKYLRVIGVGYKFFINKNNSSELLVQAGLTHLLKQKLHSSIVVEFTRKNRMTRARSVSLSMLTNTLACLRNKRKPNAFTGKGIRFRKQKIARKIGKKKKT